MIGVVLGALAGMLLAFIETLWLLSVASASFRVAADSLLMMCIACAGLMPMGAFVGLAGDAYAAELASRFSFVQKAVIAPLLVAFAVVVVVIDARVLPHLYVSFHVVLDVIAWTALFFALQTARRWVSLRGAIYATMILTLWLTAMVIGIRTFQHESNLRWVAHDYAPVTGDWIDLLADPPPDPERGVIRGTRKPSKANGGQTDATDPGAGPGDGGVPASSNHLDGRDRDLLLITVDALRADRLRAWGGRGRTPQLDAIAAHSMLFMHAYTNTPNTSYAMSSLMTGQDLRPIFEKRSLRDNEGGTLADLFKRIHYATAAFYTPSIFSVDHAKMSAFESRGFGFEIVQADDADAPTRSIQVQQFVDGLAADKPFFAWAHYFEPHEPYDAHGGDDSDAMGRYDAEVEFVDAAIGSLIAHVREKRPGVVVVITSDHGEEFGEHGGAYHGTSLYDEQAHIPLIISAQGLRAKKINHPIHLSRLGPTLLRWFAMVPDRSMWEAPFEVGDGSLAFASLPTQWLVTDGSYKALCSRTLACRLYDLNNDHAERFDVASRNAGIVVRLRDALRERLAIIGAHVAGTTRESPMAIIERARLGDQEAMQRLPALLSDPSEDIVVAAIETLAEARAAFAGPLMSRLVSDSRPRVSAEAMVAHALLDPAAPVQPLVERFNQVSVEQSAASQSWRRRAALVLGARGEQSAGTELIALSLDPSESFEDRSIAIEQLGHMQSTAARLPLEQLLSDLRLRVAAARALQVLGDKRAIPALRAALATEPYPLARAAESDAIESLSRRGARRR